MRYIFFAVMAASLTFSTAKAQTIFTESWDDGDGAMRWSAPIVDAENGLFDGTVDYAFDYSTLGVPSAPNSDGSTVGLFMEVNTTDQEGDEGESVAIIASDLSIPDGDFSLSMDVYYNVFNAGGGTTEYGTFGVFASGPSAPGDDAINGDAPFRFGLSDGDGLAFQATGEGGASNDVIRYVDPGNMNAGGETLGSSYDDIPFGDIPGVITGTGDPENPFSFGPEETWVEVGISSVAGMISFTMNGYELDSYDNTGGELSGGSIMLGYSDPFNSVNSTDADDITNFLVVDNVSMVVPEPASGPLMLVAVAFLGLVRRRRSA